MANFGSLNRLNGAQEWDDREVIPPIGSPAYTGKACRGCQSKYIVTND
jgi:hypothetical protein